MIIAWRDLWGLLGFFLLAVALTGCQTVGRVLQAGSRLFFHEPQAINPIWINPWPVLGALLCILSVCWGLWLHDWRRASGGMIAGVGMGAVGVGLSHPWAPVLCLVFIPAGIIWHVHHRKKCPKSNK